MGANGFPARTYRRSVRAGNPRPLPCTTEEGRAFLFYSLTTFGASCLPAEVRRRRWELWRFDDGGANGIRTRDLFRDREAL